MTFSATFSGPMLSLAQAEIRVAGVQIIGATKMDFSCGVTAEPEYGSGPIALGTPIGIHKAEFGMDQHLQEAYVLQKLLNGKSGGAGFSQALVNVSLTFLNVGATIGGFTTPVRAIKVSNVRFLQCKPAPSNDGKSVIATWTCVVTNPIEWVLATGDSVYSINPALFAGSNSLSIGDGGEIIANG